MNRKVDSYLGNPNVKRDGVEEQWTQEKVNEYAKCMQDPVYFATTYCKIINLDRGLIPFEMYDYQKDMFQHFNDNRFSIVLACRQSGKSISSVIYLLWYALFQSEKNVVILANKGATAREMLSRITLALENLPFFLQPGCKALNKSSIEFSNNSKVIAAGTSASSIRGLSVNLLFLDEFAFVEGAVKFYTSTYPVITSGKNTKVIITSTANGIGNPFHHIWQGAIKGLNEYKPFRVDWWNVPGRDEKWKKETIANTSQLQFDQEFSNIFVGTGNCLINTETLLQLSPEPPRKIGEDQQLMVYDTPQRGHKYIMTVDVCKGRGQDYSTFSIFDITQRPFKQVARYRNNLISPLLFPDIIYKYGNLYNTAYVIIESNDQGMVTAYGLYHDLEYDEVHLSSAVRADGIGIEMTKKVKRVGCSGFKDLLETGKLEIVDEETINEISTFEAKGASWEATDGNHDDLVMNCVMFGFYATSSMFLEMTDINVKQMMFDQRMKEIEEDVPPFGIVEDHGASGVDIEELKEPPDPWALDWAKAEGQKLEVEDW
jgi:hypothetical protein